MRPHDPVVYVIDDDEPMRRSLVLLLSSAGYRVQTYEGPAAFLDGASVLEPGCVVTDMRMPQMSGLELMSELRAKGIPMPVILITGHGDVALAVEAMKRGAVDFLEKPFEPATLIAAIQKTIDNARVRFDLLADNRTARAALLTLSSREKDGLRGQDDRPGARHQRSHRRGIPGQGEVQTGRHLTLGPAHFRPESRRLTQGNPGINRGRPHANRRYHRVRS